MVSVSLLFPFLLISTPHCMQAQERVDCRRNNTASSTLHAPSYPYLRQHVRQPNLHRYSLQNQHHHHPYHKPHHQTLLLRPHPSQSCPHQHNPHPISLPSHRSPQARTAVQTPRIIFCLVIQQFILLDHLACPLPQRFPFLKPLFSLLLLFVQRRGGEGSGCRGGRGSIEDGDAKAA